MINTPYYRQGVAILLLNKGDSIFAGKLHNRKKSSAFLSTILLNTLNIPQGGIEESHTIEQTFWKELYEEIGLQEDNTDLIKISEFTTKYTYPQELINEFARLDGEEQRHIGQIHTWCLARFKGDDNEINLNVTNKPEFCGYEWRNKEDIIEYAPFFKKEMYDIGLNRMIL